MITIKSSSYTNADYDFLLKVFLKGLTANCERVRAGLCEKCSNRASCFDLQYAIEYLHARKSRDAGKIDK